jgi:hypothetical protein
MSEVDHPPSAPAGDRDAASSRQESTQRPPRRSQLEEEPKPEMPMYMQILINTIPMLLISLLMTAGLMYYKRTRVPYQVPPPIGISVGVTIDSDIMAVYEFLSTPELRTEWHLNAVEVSGPAMDHSAIVGKILPLNSFRFVLCPYLMCLSHGNSALSWICLLQKLIKHFPTTDNLRQHMWARQNSRTVVPDKHHTSCEYPRSKQRDTFFVCTWACFSLACLSDGQCVGSSLFSLHHVQGMWKDDLTSSSWQANNFWKNSRLNVTW